VKHDTKVTGRNTRTQTCKDKYTSNTAPRHEMCKATVPLWHLSHQLPVLYQAKTDIHNKQSPNTNAVSGQWLATRSTAPGEAVVAWQSVKATMEMHDDKED
jgi:hypothetical protein